VVGDVDMDEFSTVVSKHQESEEQVEGEGRDDEEVDGVPVLVDGDSAKGLRVRRYCSSERSGRKGRRMARGACKKCGSPRSSRTPVRRAARPGRPLPQVNILLACC
jgi:hypothetical protein